MDDDKDEDVYDEEEYDDKSIASKQSGEEDEEDVEKEECGGDKEGDVRERDEGSIKDDQTDKAKENGDELDDEHGRAWIKERLGTGKRKFNELIDGIVASSTAANKSFIIKPALCSDEDEEFSRRQQLFLRLKRAGRRVEIPETLFSKLPNGNYHNIPPTIIEEYNVIISDNPKIEGGASLKRKSSIDGFNK